MSRNPFHPSQYIAEVNPGMAESPKIYQRIVDWLMDSYEKDPTLEYATTRFFIPWEDIVWTYKDGVPYVPKRIKEGLQILKDHGHLLVQPPGWPPLPYSPAGIWLTVVFGKNSKKKSPRVGFYSHDVQVSFGLINSKKRNLDSNLRTLRHELLHFTQHMGTCLLMLSSRGLKAQIEKGDRFPLLRFLKLNRLKQDLRAAHARVREGLNLDVLTAEQRQSVLAAHDAWSKGVLDSIPETVSYFGSPKKKTRDSSFTVADYHAEHDKKIRSVKHVNVDIEYHTDALSAALDIAAKIKRKPQLINTIRFYELITLKASKIIEPQKRLRFMQLVIANIERELQEKIGLNRALLPVLSAAIGVGQRLSITAPIRPAQVDLANALRSDLTRRRGELAATRQRAREWRKMARDVYSIPIKKAIKQLGIPAQWRNWFSAVAMNAAEGEYGPYRDLILQYTQNLA
jgi:hypothetical protein